MFTYSKIVVTRVALSFVQKYVASNSTYVMVSRHHWLLRVVGLVAGSAEAVKASMVFAVVVTKLTPVLCAQRKKLTTNVAAMLQFVAIFTLLIPCKTQLALHSTLLFRPFVLLIAVLQQHFFVNLPTDVVWSFSSPVCCSAIVSLHRIVYNIGLSISTAVSYCLHLSKCFSIV